MSESGSLKAQCNESHANYRGFIRYGFTSTIIDNIIKSVKHANGINETKYYEVIPLRKDNKVANRYIYAVAVDYKWIPIVWCKSTRTIVTVLPEESIDTYINSLPVLVAKKTFEQPSLPTTHEEIDLELKSIKTELVALSDCHMKEKDKSEKKRINSIIIELSNRRKQLNAVKLTLPKQEEEYGYQGHPDLEHFRIITRLMQACKLSASLLEITNDSSLSEMIKDANAYLERNGISL